MALFLERYRRIMSCQNVERNANPQAAARGRGPTSGSAGYLLTLRPGGAQARLAQSTLAVSDPTGQVLLQANAQSGSIQIDPEGRLAYSDGYTITRWNPATRQSRSFAYSFPDHYGSEDFDGMVALPGGRTLVIGTAGNVRPHLVSVHHPDGSPGWSIDLANEGGATIDEIFVSNDRGRIYLSCHHNGSGHAVHRLRVAELAWEKLTFHPSKTMFEYRALVTEKEEILLLQGARVQRYCSRGVLRKKYESLSALHRDLGGPARTLARVPLGEPV